MELLPRPADRLLDRILGDVHLTRDGTESAKIVPDLTREVPEHLGRLFPSHVLLEPLRHRQAGVGAAEVVVDV